MALGGCGIAVSIISLNIGILCLVASLSLLLVGYTFETDYVGEFTAYNAATCTLVEFKVVTAEAPYESFERYLAVAGVTLLSSPTVYAAVKQANTSMSYTSPLAYSREGAINTTFPADRYRIGASYPCGVPSDGNPPASFSEATAGPFERAVAFDFNREEAIAYIEIGSSLVIAGWVCIGIGVVCVPLGIFMMCGCEDCCEDCCDDCCDDCECSCSCDSCCDRYEEWKLEQRLNTSRKERAKSAAASNSAAANNSADFDAEGNLTHYTCEYGVGEWCGFFCRELAGKKPVPAAPPKPMDIQRMEKGETSTSAKKDDKSLDDVFAPEADVDDGKGPAIELALKAKPAVVEATPPADTKEKESEAKKQPKKTASEADSEEESASASVRSV